MVLSRLCLLQFIPLATPISSFTFGVPPPFFLFDLSIHFSFSFRLADVWWQAWGTYTGTDLFGDTICVNAAICGEGYVAAHEPIVVDLLIPARAPDA